MKQSIFTLLAILLIWSCNQKQETAQSMSSPIFDEEAEVKAIMAVIKNETKCFFDGNYECWASNWSHADYAMQAWNNSNGTSDAAVGWEAINKQGKGWIETYYKNGENIIHPDFIATKLKVKFFGNEAAYLMWTQYNADQDKKFYRVSQETRVIEKESDGWKIVNVSAFWEVSPKVVRDSIPAELIN